MSDGNNETHENTDNTEATEGRRRPAEEPIEAAKGEVHAVRRDECRDVVGAVDGDEVRPDRRHGSKRCDRAEEALGTED